MRARALKNPRHPIQWIERGLKLEHYDKTVCVGVLEDVSGVTKYQMKNRERSSAHNFQVVKDKLIEFMRDEDELFDALFKVCTC